MRLIHGRPRACMYTSLAMVLDKTEEEVIAELCVPLENHFFGENKHRSPHIREITEYLFDRGLALITIDPDILFNNPYDPDDKVHTVPGEAARYWTKYPQRGLIDTRVDGRNHFVAYEGSTIFDPSGYITQMRDRDYYHQIFYPIVRVAR